ncbi:Potassium channel subfamily K member 18 [Strongyloides ratti]|uniref:Potassium channel subfamily K member 18 n=1 Tax=Strongyloides ratti TaxID=34506 RepID=A0A090LNE8_STRRB|nr:Potassium channel subfamily K member 18 [Strongyloides ratti]CEF71256.1 Potassium channel subfamily K member 18 [Strongyloides ratti]
MNSIVNKLISLKDSKKYLNQATPFIVHLLMICGVAIYAMFGAIVMQSLEAIPIIKEHPSKGSIKNSNNRESRELIKSEDNEMLKVNRHCLISTLQKSINDICSDEDTSLRSILYSIDSCYHVILNSKSVDSLHVIEKIIYNTKTGKDEVVLYEEWSFSDSILFAFTVITTIGYGNVAPKSFGGRMFCIFYGLIGIPFTLLAIADLGKFISEVMVSASNIYTVGIKKIKKKLRLYRDNKYFGFILKQIIQKSPSNSKKVSIYINPEHVEDLENGLNYKEDLNKIERPLMSQNNNCLRNSNKNCNSNDNIYNYEDKTSILEFENNKKKEEESDSEDEEKSHSYSNQTCSLMGLFIIYIILGGMMLSAYEPEMTFFNAIYFNFVSLTSIGLGDIVPKSQEYMFFTIIYIAIGLALTTIAIDIAADYLKKLHYFGRKIENVASVTIWFGGKKLTMGQLVKNLGDQFNLPMTTIKNLNLDDFVDKAIKVEAGEIESLRPPPLEPKNIMTLDESVSFADGSDDWIPNDKEDFTPFICPKNESPIIESFPKILTPIVENFPTLLKEEIPIRTPTPEILSPTPSSKVSIPKCITPILQKIETPEPEIELLPPIKTPSPEVKEEDTSVDDYLNQKRRGYSEDAWRRYQEYQKQWQKLRQVKHNKGKSPNRKFFSVVETVTDEVLKNEKKRKASEFSYLSSNTPTSSESSIKFDKKNSLQHEMFRPISRNRSSLSSSTNKSTDIKRKKSPSVNTGERVNVKHSNEKNNLTGNDETLNIIDDNDKNTKTNLPVKGKPPSITSLSTRLPKGSR